MLNYETINVWDTIHEILIDWIESVIKEGWNIWRGEERLKEIADNLTKKIMKSLCLDLGVPEFQMNRLMDLFHPVIYTWIDNILLTKADFFRDPQKFNKYAIAITSDLVRLFLDEEELVEFV
ncbi:MAG: hypothetical protein HGN29_16605 [Asgard group archaeon]|nr:hypothetical protein [Asgard group archaeon]